MTTMEDLTKTQIVLLALLVSFITSIATGIITTSLLAQAPQNITQTIDRVVERTVERVAPAPDGSETTREVTIVREDDAIALAIEKNAKSIVRIFSPVGPDGSEQFYALGVIVSREGHIITDRREQIVLGAPYKVVFSDGSTLTAVISKVGDPERLVLFRLEASEARLRGLSVATLSPLNPKLGQSVVAIQGRENTIVSVGRILSLPANSGSALTDISPSNEISGGALLNLTGELVGLKTSNPDLTLPAGSYTLISPIAQFIAQNT